MAADADVYNQSEIFQIDSPVYNVGESITKSEIGEFIEGKLKAYCHVMENSYSERYKVAVRRFEDIQIAPAI